MIDPSIVRVNTLGHGSSVVVTGASVVVTCCSVVVVGGGSVTVGGGSVVVTVGSGGVTGNYVVATGASFVVDVDSAVVTDSVVVNGTYRYFHHYCFIQLYIPLLSHQSVLLLHPAVHTIPVTPACTIASSRCT